MNTTRELKDIIFEIFAVAQRKSKDTTFDISKLTTQNPWTNTFLDSESADNAHVLRILHDGFSYRTTDCRTYDWPFDLGLGMLVSSCGGRRSLTLRFGESVSGYTFKGYSWDSCAPGKDGITWDLAYPLTLAKMDEEIRESYRDRAMSFLQTRKSGHYGYNSLCEFGLTTVHDALAVGFTPAQIGTNQAEIEYLNKLTRDMNITCWPSKIEIPWPQSKVTTQLR